MAPALALIPIFLACCAAVAGGRKKAASVSLSLPMRSSEETRRVLEAFANGTARANATLLRGHEACCAECAGIQFTDKIPFCGLDTRCQLVRNATDLLRTGEGNCIEIAAFDAGAAIRDGKQARVELRTVRPFVFHAVASIESEDQTDVGPGEMAVVEVDPAQIGGGCACGA